MAFSPPSVTTNNFLVAGSWDNNVRCWEINTNATTVPKAQQTMGGPILDVCWHDDGTKVFMASCDKQVKCWDLRAQSPMLSIDLPERAYCADVDYPMAVV